VHEVKPSEKKNERRRTVASYISSKTNIAFDKCSPVMIRLAGTMGQQLRVRAKRKRRARQEKRQKVAAKAAAK